MNNEDNKIKIEDLIENLDNKQLQNALVQALAVKEQPSSVDQGLDLCLILSSVFSAFGMTISPQQLQEILKGSLGESIQFKVTIIALLVIVMVYQGLISVSDAKDAESLRKNPCLAALRPLISDVQVSAQEFLNHKNVYNNYEKLAKALGLTVSGGLILTAAFLIPVMPDWVQIALFSAAGLLVVIGVVYGGLYLSSEKKNLESKYDKRYLIKKIGKSVAIINAVCINSLIAAGVGVAGITAFLSLFGLSLSAPVSIGLTIGLMLLGGINSYRITGGAIENSFGRIADWFFSGDKARIIKDWRFWITVVVAGSAAVALSLMSVTFVNQALSVGPFISTVVFGFTMIAAGLLLSSFFYDFLNKIDFTIGESLGYFIISVLIVSLSLFLNIFGPLTAIAAVGVTMIFQRLMWHRNDLSESWSGLLIDFAFFAGAITGVGLGYTAFIALSAPVWLAIMLGLACFVVFSAVLIKAGVQKIIKVDSDSTSNNVTSQNDPEKLLSFVQDIKNLQQNHKQKEPGSKQG